MPKRRNYQRYETPTGYRFSKSKYEQLKRAIKNYNSRLYRAYSNTDERLQYILPDRLRLTDLRDRVTSTKDVNELITRLDMYRKEGFELVQNPYGNGYITKAQLEVAEREARQENRRRRRLQQMAERGAEAEGRLPTDQTAALRPVNAGVYTVNSQDPLANIMYGRRIGEQTIAWQQRYIEQLRLQMELLPTQGFSMSTIEEMHQKFMNIIQMVENLSPEDYYYAQLVFPNTSISIVSDERQIYEGLSELEETWENFYNSVRG